MLIRLNQLAAGGSGINPQFPEALEHALRTDALPAVHITGTIGTGDLTALAEIALTLIGRRPWVRGRVPPVAVGPGDALAFMSSSAVSLARAVLACEELSRLLDASHVVAALSYCALGGSAEAFAAEVHARRPHPGAVRTAAEMRRILWHEGERSPGRRIQDPFGLRAFPQVQGAALDGVTQLRRILEIEINAAAENPLIDADSGAVFHHGQFSTAYPALSLDHVRAAVHHVAELCAARLGDLVEPDLTGLPAFLASGPAGSSGVMILEYVAHDALGRLRHSAGPVTLGTAVISRGLEDHASFSPHAAGSALAAAAAYRTMLACELVAATRALRMAGTPPRGTVLAAAFAHATDRLPDIRADHQLERRDPDRGAAARRPRRLLTVCLQELHGARAVAPPRAVIAVRAPGASTDQQLTRVFGDRPQATRGNGDQPRPGPHRSGDGERLRVAGPAARRAGKMMISQQEYAGGITAPSHVEG